MLFSCTNNNKAENEKSKSSKKAKEIEIDKVYELPDDLNEISGITFVNDSIIASIQDENGILFLYNLKTGKIVKKIKFAKDGDYEDLTLTNGKLNIINSSGTIYEIENYDGDEVNVNEIKTEFKKSNDIESIFFEKQKDRFLIGTKGKNLDREKNILEIYEYDLKSRQLNKQPIIKLNVDRIEEYFKIDAVEESAKELLKTLGNKNLEHVFHISALTVNPKTNEILVLSSLNNLVAVLSENGELKEVYKLKGKQFKQPEGIAFSPNGDLYISNENGGKGKGNIIKVSYEN